MIYHLNQHNAKRHYLNQWFFTDTLVVLDTDIWDIEQTHGSASNDVLSKLLAEHPCKNVVVDLSQNSFPAHLIPQCLKDVTVLTSMYSEWYNQSTANTHFFPIWHYMYSHRNNFHNAHCHSFDALGTKTQGIMCLNRGGRPHRLQFYDLIKDYHDRMCLTVPVDASLHWQDRRLPGDTLESDNLPVPDLGVQHAVYTQYAVNLVTETQIQYPSLTEKSCKPFIARQIPILVGHTGINQFHVDLGFDMFEDLVPWRQWDQQTDTNIKLTQIADFVKRWIDSGSILLDYNRVKNRVEKNKQHFHSDVFRNLIMKNMPQTNPYHL